MTDDCPFEKYSYCKDAKQANNNVYDLVISGLPHDAQTSHLRQIAGAKHVVEATVESDSIKNVCTGVGKVRVRLGEGEDLEQVKVNFLSAGLQVHDANYNSNLKPVFSYKQSLMDRSP
jgi:hypothetical protein